MCGEWRTLRQTRAHCGYNTSSFTWTLQLFVAELSVGSAPVLIIGRGRHGRIRHQPALTWVCWWRQVAEEEVHLCRAGAAGHNFFFSALWGKATSRWRCRRLAQCCNFRSDARRRDVFARIRAARPSYYLWPTGCSGRDRWVQLTAIIGGKLNGPRDGIILGLFCRARTD